MKAENKVKKLIDMFLYVIPVAETQADLYQQHN